MLLTGGGGQERLHTVLQCDPGSVLRLVQTLLTIGDQCGPVVLAVERFIVAMRSSRLSTPRAAATTRDMVGAVTALGRELPGVSVVQRCAAEVMPWASDKRLTAAGLYDITRAMPHARAAARHALFAAVRDCGLPDPLSAKARAT
jgi:hypothetical protein